MFYRKYRPQIWKELDDKRIRETLGKAVLENNWASAYLLTGSRGTGKTTTARLIAKTVNCPKRKAEEEPCNKCDSCKAITVGNSLDVMEIDAASNTGVDDIRSLREKVKLAPTVGPYKVYIIDEVHMLSTSAFNALLKTLEEPPAHVIFVLATTDPGKLPETIVSRCLVYNFGQAAMVEIKEKLRKITAEEKIKIREEEIDLIVQRARGSHRDAQKLLEQLTSAGAKTDLERLDALDVKISLVTAQNILAALKDNDSAKGLRELGDYVKANGKLKELISDMISLLRENILSKYGNNNEQDGLLIKKLLEAYVLVRESPIPSLPLELVIVEWCGSEKSENQKIREFSGSDSSNSPKLRRSEFSEKWPEIVAATKSVNHSLNAFLKAAKPQGWANGCLTVEVAYKFHKEKLEEPKNRDILEQVMSDIMGKKIRVKFELRR